MSFYSVASQASYAEFIADFSNVHTKDDKFVPSEGGGGLKSVYGTDFCDVERKIATIGRVVDEPEAEFSINYLARFPDNLKGEDNYGRPRVEYAKKVAAMSDGDLQDEAYDMIYQSARCSNNSRADWHWMVDTCYREGELREKPHIYRRAYKECYADHAG